MGPDDHDDEGFPGLGRRIMIAAIFSLFIVVMLLILLHFYARYLAKRQERRRLAFLNSLASQVLPIDPAITFPVYPEPPPQAPPGLNSSVIASLPTFEYAPEKGLDGGGGEQMECSVCLSLVAGGARVRLLPNCKHLFHADCIDKWLSSHTTCPICRTGAQPERVQHEVKPADTRVQPSAPPIGGDAQDLERQ